MDDMKTLAAAGKAYHKSLEGEVYCVPILSMWLVLTPVSISNLVCGWLLLFSLAMLKTSSKVLEVSIVNCLLVYLVYL